MKNSRYFGDIVSAREFEVQAQQMFNYATNPLIIEASCYFLKGAELMQKALTSQAIKECKEQREVTEE